MYKLDALALLLLLLFTFYDCTQGRFCRGGMTSPYDSIHSATVPLRNEMEEDAGWIYTFLAHDRFFFLQPTHSTWNRTDLESAPDSWQVSWSIGEAKDSGVGYVQLPGWKKAIVAGARSGRAAS